MCSKNLPDKEIIKHYTGEILFIHSIINDLSSKTGIESNKIYKGFLKSYLLGSKEPLELINKSYDKKFVNIIKNLNLTDSNYKEIFNNVNNKLIY